MIRQNVMFLLKSEWGMVALVTTDLLSPNIYDFDLIGTPRYLNVCLISIKRLSFHSLFSDPKPVLKIAQACHIDETHT